jgi:type I restriction enzyme S subunit
MTFDYRQLSDFADVKGGKRLPKGKNLTTSPTQHPYIRVRDLGTEKVLELNSDYEYVDEETQATIARYIVNADDVIISIVGTIGLVAKIGMSLDGANLTENCAKMVNIHDLDRDFLYYYLLSEDGQNAIKAATVGAVQAKLPLKNIQSLLIPVVPLYEQQAIAATLSALDARIAENRKINHHLEQMAQAIFKSWLVDFEPFGGVMPDDWREGSFSEVISTTLGGDWGKDAPTGNNTQEVYCIRGADIPDVNVGNKGKMPTRFILPKNYVSKRLAVGDIVVEISGGSPTQSTGRCALITQSLLDRYDRGMVCTNFCRAVKPSDGYSAFVYFYWKYLYDQRVMFSYENGTTGIKNLDITGFLENEPIIIPPIGVVAQFTEAVEIFIDTIFANGLENEGLATTRDALLPRLMSGDLSVADLSDAK